MQKGIAPLVFIVIIAAIALVGGAVWYFIAGPGSSSPSTSTPERTRESSAGTIGEVTDTMDALIGRGENLECDWRMPASSGETPFTTGKLYTTGNKGRSHMSGNVSGVAMAGNAIFRDGTVYTWMEFAGQKMGFKMDPDELRDANMSMTPEERQQAEQIRAEMIFNCRPWTPDESQFALPADVTFR